MQKFIYFIYLNLQILDFTKISHPTLIALECILNQLYHIYIIYEHLKLLRILKNMFKTFNTYLRKSNNIYKEQSMFKLASLYELSIPNS